MSRIAKTAKVKIENSIQGWPVVVHFALFGGAFLGYLIGRIGLNGYPHPLHWLSGGLGAVIGFLGGWIWYRARGDII